MSGGHCNVFGRSHVVQLHVSTIAVLFGCLLKALLASCADAVPKPMHPGGHALLNMLH